MKFVDEFRDAALAAALARRIASEVDSARRYGFMEFCGGHTHAIARYGVTELLPPAVRMIHGPGCPVCVLPIGRIDQAIALGLEHRAIVCTYGDTLRVPASSGLSLTRARAMGADVRTVYSAADVLAIAVQNPTREVVFFAIGFETTTPPTALLVRQARRQNVSNLSVLCCHVLTPPAMMHLLSGAGDGPADAGQLDGFVGPAHVSVVIGSEPYERFARQHAKPVVIAGFEPLDVMQAILMLVRQVNRGQAAVENQFTRAVSRTGNPAAIAVMREVFEIRDSFEWRGLGPIAKSALRLRETFRDLDAEHRFGLGYRAVPDHRQCECGAILKGDKTPTDCKLFGTVCTPESPMGSCMVSPEGACAAHYAYGRFRKIPVAVAT